MKKYEGKIRLAGKEYDVKVEDGKRLVKIGEKWLTADEFMKTQSEEIKLRLARVGKMALEDEQKGVKPAKGKYQYYAEDYYK